MLDCLKEAWQHGYSWMLACLSRFPHHKTRNISVDGEHQQGRAVSCSGNSRRGKRRSQITVVLLTPCVLDLLKSLEQKFDGMLGCRKRTGQAGQARNNRSLIAYPAAWKQGSVRSGSLPGNSSAIPASACSISQASKHRVSWDLFGGLLILYDLFMHLGFTWLHHVSASSGHLSLRQGLSRWFCNVLQPSTFFLPPRIPLKVLASAT